VSNDKMNLLSRNQLAFFSSVLLGASLTLCSVQAQAQRIGFSRLLSSYGKPLEVNIPIDSIKPEDIGSIRVKLADKSQWELVGLKPPADLSTMSVGLKSGPAKDSLIAVVVSTNPVKTQIVDILLEVISPAGVQVTQVGFIVPGSTATVANVNVAPNTVSPATSSQSGSSVTVKRGDSLFAIAEKNIPAGASIYQTLWALFEANPQAFISKNMNLLISGATIKVPDAAVILAVDPTTARDMYAQQAREFNTLRGGRTAPSQPKVVVPANTQTGVVKPADVAPAPKDESGDKVTLSAQSDADKEADARAAAAKQLKEEQERLAALEQNIKQLKEVASSSSSTTDAKPSDNAVAAKSDDSSKSQAVDSKTTVKQQEESSDKKSKNQGFSFLLLTNWLLDNMLIVIAALLAIAALVIAWMMRAAGKRNDQDDDNDDVTVELDQAVSSYFESIRQEGHVEPKHIYDETANTSEPSKPESAAEMLNKINLDLDSPLGDEKSVKPKTASQSHPTHPPEN
jgi:FimV-like protein